MGRWNSLSRGLQSVLFHFSFPTCKGTNTDPLSTDLVLPQVPSAPRGQLPTASSASVSAAGVQRDTDELHCRDTAGDRGPVREGLRNRRERAFPSRLLFWTLLGAAFFLSPRSDGADCPRQLLLSESSRPRPCGTSQVGHGWATSLGIGGSRKQNGPHSCVTLDKTSYFSGSQSVHLSIGDDNAQATS